MKLQHVKDHSISKEEFTLIQYSEGLLQTQPIPENLSQYYESENYISHTDANTSLVDKIYQFVKKINLASKFKIITKYQSQPGKVLDIGCGTGDFLVYCKSKGWEVTGFEPSPKAASLAKSKQIQLAKNLQELPEASFDCITLWHVLEHVVDLEMQIATLKRLLKKDGLLIIAVPNYKSFDAQYYGSYWAAYDVPRHIWHFSKEAINRIFTQAGFRSLKFYPMWFDSFYVSLLSETYKKSKLKYIKSLGIGFWSNFKGLWTKEYSSHIYCFKKN